MAQTAPNAAGASTGERAQATKHIHHGRTLAAWVGSVAATIAVIVGGIALMIPNWPLFWVAAGLLVAAAIAAKVLQVTGHGAD